MQRVAQCCCRTSVWRRSLSSGEQFGSGTGLDSGAALKYHPHISRIPWGRLTKQHKSAHSFWAKYWTNYFWQCIASKGNKARHMRHCFDHWLASCLASFLVPNLGDAIQIFDVWSQESCHQVGWITRTLARPSSGEKRTVFGTDVLHVYDRYGGKQVGNSPRVQNSNVAK